MPLPAGFSANIAGFNNDFWGQEAKVNGLWCNMFSLNYPLGLGVNSFLVSPESVPPGVKRLRPDLIVGRITNANGLMIEHAVYEGKSSTGDDWDKIGTQLNDYFTSRDLNEFAWAIGARGSEFRIWFWSRQLLGIQLNAAGAPSRTGQADGPTYRLAGAGAMPQGQLQGFLTSIIAVPIVLPP